MIEIATERESLSRVGHFYDHVGVVLTWCVSLSFLGPPHLSPDSRAR